MINFKAKISNLNRIKMNKIKMIIPKVLREDNLVRDKMTKTKIKCWLDDLRKGQDLFKRIKIQITQKNCDLY